MTSNSKLVAKIETEEPTQRLALLIDADNAQASVIEGILAEVARFGEATVRRIYGDFTAPTSAQWKKVLTKYSIKPIQQFAYTTGKNATDSMLIIDAMDLLYTRRFDGFCLVSSDSDFTGIAIRIREEGLLVYGFGEQKTPEAFRNACHKFVFTELLAGEYIPVNKPSTLNPGTTTTLQETVRNNSALSIPPTTTDQPFPADFFLDALNQSSDETGWARLSTFGSYLVKIRPDFDSRTYRHKKLIDLVKAHPELFRVEERTLTDSGTKELYIRKK
jgi:uncharacterized LabA/DUF88 family protein